MMALLLVYERDSKDLFHSLGPPILILSFVSSQIIFMKRNISCREEKMFSFMKIIPFYHEKKSEQLVFGIKILSR